MNGWTIEAILVGIFLFIVGIFFFLLKTSLSVILGFYLAMLIFIGVINVVIYFILKEKTGKDDKDAEPDYYNKYTKVVADIAFEELGAEIGEVYAKGIEKRGMAGMEKKDVFILFFRDKSRDRKIAFAINVKKPSVKKYLVNPTSEQVERLVDSVADSKSEFQTIMRERIDPLTGAMLRENVTQPVLFQKEPSKDKNEELSDI